MIMSARRGAQPLFLSPNDSTYSYPVHASARRLESPLPSPGLVEFAIPTPLKEKARISRELKTQEKRRVTTKLLGWALGVAVIFWFAVTTLSGEHPPVAISYLSNDGKAYEIVGADELPDKATPMIFTDGRGRSRWTISIPSRLDFPLYPSDYTDICSQAADIARQVEELKGHGGSHSHSAHYSYYHVDSNFMDVGDAESHGLLLGGMAGAGSSAEENRGKATAGEDVAKTTEPGGDKICERSLTYVLGSEDASMGSNLMGLWLSYGLAQKEGRGFFLDDSTW